MSWPDQGRYGRLTQPDCYPELKDLPANLLLAYHGADPWHIGNLKGNIVYCQIGEYLRDQNIKELLSANDCNYIFIVPHAVSQNLIDKYQHRARFIFPKYAYAYYSRNLEHYPEQFKQIIISKKQKHFLSLNNRATWYRQGLFYFFANYNLRNKAHFSYIGERAWTGKKDLRDLDDCFKTPDGKNVWYADKIDLEECKKLIPLYTGMDNFSINDWSIGNLKYYSEAFMSIVTETYSAQEYPFFTEKIFKPIAFGHPFLLHGGPNSLAKLKEIGFETFDDWIDSNYDTVCENERFESMLKIILKIADLNTDDLNHIYTEMLPKIKHNYDYFTNDFVSLYNREVEEIKTQILDLL